MSSEFITVARLVLQNHSRPMTAREIWEQGSRDGLFSDKIAGLTPHQTLKSKVSTHIRRLGTRSEFVRTGPGKFHLRSLVRDEKDIYAAARYLPAKPVEEVIVLSEHAINTVGRFQGISKRWDRLRRDLITHRNCSTMWRQQAEQDDTKKQLLTYVLIRRGDSVLGFKRGMFSWTERMLLGARCIGFGGHITKADANDLFDYQFVGIRRNAAREISEELRLPKTDAERLMNLDNIAIHGVLNDDSSAVGRRHLAIICSYTVSNDKYWDAPQRGEKAVSQLGWLRMSDPVFRLHEFEYWSQLCLREFFGDYVRMQPRYSIRRHTAFKSPDIVCVCGEIGSGKTEAVQVISDRCGFASISSGQMIANCIGCAPIPKTARRDFQRLAEAFVRAPDGPSRLAKAILDEAQRSGFPVVVDGIRHPETLECLRLQSGGRNIALLYVHTPADVAFRFWRGRGIRYRLIVEFFEERDAPVEAHTKSLIGQADAVIYNWEGMKEYKALILRLVRELGLKRKTAIGY
jgi:predicted NUDIX family phosphoesterase/dephospho-CoA kinase